MLYNLGYVLSKLSLKKFVTEALVDPNICKEDPTGAEDAEIGKTEYIGKIILQAMTD